MNMQKLLEILVDNFFAIDGTCQSCTIEIGEEEILITDDYDNEIAEFKQLDVEQAKVDDLFIHIGECVIQILKPVKDDELKKLVDSYD